MIKRPVENIRIVMVETTHPGNIGAAARAMKTMGYSNLYLVKPKIYPNAEATARAAGADDILAKAVICDSLEQALHGCVAVVATTARPRTISHPVFTPREYASKLSEMVKHGPVALVFGRESSGLSNEELEYCNVVLQIPTNPDFSSLNVASAVQILCYEFIQVLQPENTEKTNAEIDEKTKVKLATADEMNYFYDHLEKSMIDVGFLNPEQPRKLMRRLKSLFNRANLDENEMSILRGFLAAVQDAASKKKIK
ncbi:MAG: RNA methyltransferase [Gammaproteobacteria bacterium]|nr:RNA methyltransferase [Gammaproteobacteria bacterium]